MNAKLSTCGVCQTANMPFMSVNMSGMSIGQLVMKEANLVGRYIPNFFLTLTPISAELDLNPVANGVQANGSHQS